MMSIELYSIRFSPFITLQIRYIQENDTWKTFLLIIFVYIFPTLNGSLIHIHNIHRLHLYLFFAIQPVRYLKLSNKENGNVTRHRGNNFSAEELRLHDCLRKSVTTCPDVFHCRRY